MNELIQTLSTNLKKEIPRLDEVTLGSSLLAHKIQQSFPEKEIQLEVALSSIEEGEDSLRFQAQANSALRVNHQVLDCLFFVVDSKLHCLIKMIMPSVWDFSWSFPDLPDYPHYGGESITVKDSFFHDLKFAPPPKIVFSSYDFQADNAPINQLAALDGGLDSSKVHLGLNFFVTLDLENMEWLKLAIQFVEHDATTLIGNGFIDTQPNGDEQIKLFFDVPLTKRFADTFEVGISSLVFYSSVTLYADIPSSGIVFVGGLTFGQVDHPPRNVELIWPIGSNQLVIRNGEPIPFPGFDAFTNLIPDHMPNQDSNHFPIETSQLDALTIREISIHLSSIIPPVPAFVTFSVGPGPAWEFDILDGAIAIEDILLRWDIFFGGGPSNNVEFSVLSAFRLGGGRINVSAEFPDFVFQGELGFYQTADLSQIFKHFLPQASIPEIDILDLSLTADFKQKIYAFEIDIATDWQIELGTISVLPLKFLRINLEKTDLNSFATIEGMLKVGGVDILLLASNAGQQNFGWQFEGSTGRGQSIPIGELINELAQKFGGNPTLPAAITHLEFRNLDAAFNTENKDFRFVGEAEFPISEAFRSQVDILVNIDINNQVDGSFSKRFSGFLSVELPTTILSFDVIFDSENQVIPQLPSGSDPSTPAAAPASIQNETFLALYKDETGVKLKIDGLLHAFGMSDVNTGLFFTLKEVLVAYHKTSASQPDTSPQPEQIGTVEPTTTFGRWLFGIDIEAGISLSAIHIDQLPFVHIPPDQALTLDFQVLVASQPFKQDDVAAVMALAPNGGFEFPIKEVSEIDLNVTLSSGNFSKQVDLPIGVAKQPITPDQNGTAATTPQTNQNGLVDPINPPTASSPPVLQGNGGAVTSQTGVRWIKLQKQLGPLAFERVGVKYADNKVTALLDASFSAGGLTIALNGLSMSSPISEFSPTFGLDGLGIDFKNASVEIGGTFLKEPNGFAGLAVIRTEALSLSAIGAYAYADGEPSLFIYAVLDYPFGGPAFFYVTGLAAGFGYNRRLVVPDIEQVASFPLVREAAGETQTSAAALAPLPTDQQGRANTLQSKIRALDQYIPIENGQYFLAVGIKFTSFKQIDSFALLVVQFGNKFEIDLLGLSTLKIPSPAEDGTAVTPVAEAQLALKAVFIPSEGFLGVHAQLTSNSYILSRACALTGGFAFYSWFSGEHAGDFVLTLGGYHPAFNVPAHYPTVPRLGFSWRVSDNFYLHGELYFALTANALMAGGRLDALFQTSLIKAWFIAGADFLIAWKPYHYEISVYVSLGLEVTFTFFGTHTIGLSADANLKLWGPEFGGEAHIKVKVLFFKIPIDITFGNQSKAIPAITFDEFEKSYIPAEENQVCSVSIKSGLIETVTENGEEIWIVNAKEMALVTNSTIPSSQGTLFGQEAAWNGSVIAIQPMGVKSSEIITTHEVVLTGPEEDWSILRATPISKKSPYALWGQPEFSQKQVFQAQAGQRYVEEPQVNGKRFVEDTLAGYEIRVGKRPLAGAAHPIPKEALQSEIEETEVEITWQPITLNDPIGSAGWEAAVGSEQLVNNPERDDIFTAMGLQQLEVDFGEPVQGTQ